MMRLLFSLILAALPLLAGIQTVPPFYYPAMPAALGASAAVSNCLIDAASEKCGIVMQAPKSGNIATVRFRTGTVTTGDTVDVRLETVGADGWPTGTLLDTDTNAAVVIADGDDSAEKVATLTAAASVTVGDFIAVVVVNGGSGGNMNIAFNADDVYGNFPRGVEYVGAPAWAHRDSSPIMALGYDDSSYAWIPTVFPETGGYGNISIDGTPTHGGARFQLPVKMRAKGAWIHGYMAAAGSFVVKLYSGAVTELASVTVDSDYLRNAGTQSEQIALFFAAPVELEASTWYRLVVYMASGTFQLEYYAAGTAAAMDATPGGQNWHRTEATSPTIEGDWSQTTTDFPLMGLIIDGIDVPSGGSGAAMPTVISQ